MAGESSRNRSNMSELGEKRHCADPGDSCKCGNMKSNAEEGCLPVFGTRPFLFGTLQMWHALYQCPGRARVEAI